MAEHYTTDKLGHCEKYLNCYEGKGYGRYPLFNDGDRHC